MPYSGLMLATLVPLAGWRIDNGLAPFYISEKYFHFRLFGSERKCVHVLFWNFDVKYLLKYYLKSGDFAYFWNKWKVIFKRDSNIIISSSQTKKMVGSRVYVGGLPFGVRERDLEKFFKGFGRIRDILIKNGYGFVEFDDYRDADDAVYELNGKELLGERVVVEPARGIDRSAERSRRDRHYDRDRGGRSRYEYGPPTRTEYRLVVENLSSRISWQDLKDYMRQAGEVTYADAHKQHRNEGVVEFSSHADMRAAIEKLDGTELNGRRIRLVEDKRSSRRRSRSSSSRSRSRSRSRGRRASRSRSRSRSRSKPRSKTKSPAAKSRSRSRSKDRSRSKSRSGSPDRRRRSVSRKSDDRPRRSTSRSKSRSPKKSMSKERSRSRSKGASPKQDDRRKSVSKSRSRSRSPRSARSASRDRSVSRGRSRSASPRTNGDANGRNSADRSPRSGD